MKVVFAIHPCAPYARFFDDLIRIPFVWQIIYKTYRFVKQ